MCSPNKNLKKEEYEDDFEVDVDLDFDEDSESKGRHNVSKSNASFHTPQQRENSASQERLISRQSTDQRLDKNNTKDLDFINSRSATNKLNLEGEDVLANLTAINN